MKMNTHTFIGCDAEYDESDIVLFGAPFDSTTSFRPGARFASSTMRSESFGIETYSPYLDLDLAQDASVFDSGDLELPFGNPDAALSMIEERAGKILDDRKLPFMIGGEHLVTLGAVRAAAKRHPGLHIVHFDAHADMRDDYLGVRLSHATVIRRCRDMLGPGRIYQFGIRSGDREEFAWAAANGVNTCKFGFATLPEAVKALAGQPVYMTLDLDVLDPSQFPGTGTPEAGGVTFTELREALGLTLGLDVVAMDMNELSPMYDHSGASTALACKLLREALLLLGGKRK